MTKVTILGEEQGSEPKKKIEFVYTIDRDGFIEHYDFTLDEFENIQLLSRSYKLGKYDLMFAWDDNPNEGFLYLGHFNDGVV